MKTIENINKIESYIEVIRQIIVSKSMKDCEDNKFNSMMEKQLKIQANSIEVILSSMDVIGDTHEAIKKFFINGFGSDLGAKYLKLYGILNTIYLHSQSIISLARIFHLDNILSVEKELKNQKIMEIRHKLGAHSVNYQNSDNTISCYTPIRMCLEAQELVFLNMNPQSSESETVDLFLEIDKYLSEAQTVAKNIAEKIITTVYKTAKDKQDELMKKLNAISQEEN